MQTHASTRSYAGGALLSMLAIPLLVGGSITACARDDGEAAGGSPSDAAEVATMRGEAVPYGSFMRYLQDNTDGLMEDEEKSDAIKSTMLDLFLEEQLLLRAAEEMRIAVSEAEVDAFLKELGLTEGAAEVAGPNGKEGFRESVRRGLILQKLKDEEVMSKIDVTPGEVDDRLSRQPELQRGSRTVVLRQILVDDREVAERVRDTLGSDPARFEPLASEHSIAPDRGEARTYREEDLPLELRERLLALESGQISDVLEHAQRYLVFQMVHKIEAAPLDREEIRRRVELELFQEKADQVLERYIADLKSRMPIHVNRSILPFRYVGEHRN
jgi:parvulin-like peptidyl-prolyl isomerase